MRMKLLTFSPAPFHQQEGRSYYSTGPHPAVPHSHSHAHSQNSVVAVALSALQIRTKKKRMVEVVVEHTRYFQRMAAAVDEGERIAGVVVVEEEEELRIVVAAAGEGRRKGERW